MCMVDAAKNIDSPKISSMKKSGHGVFSLASHTERPSQTPTTFHARSAYLSPSERSDVATNCPLVTHPVDAIRGDAPRRAGYTDRVNGLIDALGGLPGVEPDDATLAAVITVGAAQLSAAISDDNLADHIEGVGLRAVRKLIAG